MPKRQKKPSQEKKLSTRQRLDVLINVAKTTYKASPTAVIIKIIGALINAIAPLLVAYFAAQTTTALADGYAGNAEAGSRAIVLVLITAGLGILTSIWSSLENYINELAGYKINSAVTDQLYEHFLSIEYWRYDDKETADLFDKAQSFAMFFTRFFDIISRILSAVIQVVLSIAALIYTSWWIGLMIIIAIIPSVIVQFKLSRLQAEHWRSNTETRRKMNGIQYSVFQTVNLAELRIYNAARTMLRLFTTYRDKDQLERITYERRFLAWRLGADIIEAIAEVVALLSITMQIIRHAQPIGQFIYVQQLVSRALGGMHTLANEFNGIDEDLVTMFDYEAFMRIPRTNQAERRLRSVPEMIALRDVSFNYPNTDTEVLRDITLTIPRASHIAIVGENGAGKTTLIKLLLGLYRPSRGQITIDGINLSDIREDDWHSFLGVLQQNFIKYHFSTIAENIYYGDIRHNVSDERYENAVHDAEAADFIAKLPKKRDTIPNQWFEHSDGTTGIELSGGQWQRLALARNFYRDAQIIILDEPTSAIDALAESRIFERLFRRKDTTIIAISHRLTTIRKADAVYMMKDGRIVETGTYDELVAKRGEFYHMFESQL